MKPITNAMTIAALKIASSRISATLKQYIVANISAKIVTHAIKIASILRIAKINATFLRTIENKDKFIINVNSFTSVKRNVKCITLINGHAKGSSAMKANTTASKNNVRLCAFSVSNISNQNALMNSTFMIS